LFREKKVFDQGFFSRFFSMPNKVFCCHRMRIFFAHGFFPTINDFKVMIIIIIFFPIEFTEFNFPNDSSKFFPWHRPTGSRGGAPRTAAEQARAQAADRSGQDAAKVAGAHDRLKARCEHGHGQRVRGMGVTRRKEGRKGKLLQSHEKPMFSIILDYCRYIEIFEIFYNFLK